MATKAEMLKKKQQDAAALENARKIAKEHNEVLNTAKATLPSIKRPEFNAQNSVTTNSLKGTENYNPTIMGLAQDLAQKKMFDPDTMQAVNPVSNTNEPVGSGRKFGASNTELSPVTITDNMNGDMDDPENWPTADKVRNDRLLKSDLAELKARMEENKTNPIENAVAFLPAVTGAAGKYAKAKQDAYKQAKKDYQDALVLQMNQAVRSEPGYSTMSSPIDEPARYEDPMYAVINGTNVLPIVGVGEIAKSIFTGANYTESKYMTDDDKNTYNYIYNTRGKEAATEYYNALMPQLTEREFRDNFNKTAERISSSSDDWWYVANMAGSMPENVIHSMAGVGDAVRQAGEYLFTGDIDKNDWQRYSITRTTEANNQGVSQYIMNKYKDDPKKAANVAKWVSFGYSTLQSVINSTIQALTGQAIAKAANIAGGGLDASGMLTQTTVNMASANDNSLLFRSYLGEAEAKKAQDIALDIMATSAMPSATFEAMDRGVEAPKALLTGIIAGAAEWITEKVELKELFDGATLELSTLRYWINNIVSEAKEEMLSDVINMVADLLINMDKSELVQNYNTLKNGGYSFGEIVGMMAKEKIIDIFMSGLGGGISGAISSGMQVGSYLKGNRNTGSLYAGNEAYVIEAGLNTDEGTLTNQLAKQLQEKQESGKKLSKEEIGRLAGLNAKAFQAKAAFDKADTAVERDLEMAGKQNEAILEAGMEADKNSQAYQLAQEMSSDQSKQTQENYYRLENLNQQEDAQLPESKKNASHNVAVAYQVQNDIETTGKLSKGTAEALKTASTQLSNEEAETNYTGRVAVDVGNDVGYIDDIGKTLNVYHDTESGTDVITVEVERNGRTETVGIDELAFHNTEVAQAVENATDFIQDVNASDEQKTGIIKSFLQGYLQYASNGSSISLKDYTAGFKFLFEAGANGQSIMSVSENVSSAMKGILDRMSVAQKSLAIFAGQNSQVINGKLSSSAEFKSNISADKRESMSAEERKNLETNEAFLEQLSRWVGKSITLEEEVFGSDGEEVNALYDPKTDSYKISLNATGGALAYIAIHETVHDIRVNNKEGFLELARVTLRVLEEHRAGSANRYYKYSELLYKDDTQEDILEEVIANTVPIILRNKSTREALAERMAYSENRKARNAFVKLIEGASKFFAQCATRLSQKEKLSFSQFNDGIESDRQACEDILDAYTKAIEGIHKEAVDTVKNSGVKYSKTSIRNAAISYLEDKIRFSKKKEALHKATMTLFSGSGLFEHGMPDHYIPYVACEFFEDVRKLYKANHPEVFSIENDVNTMDYAKYKGKVQHLHMSPCCQQFSPMNNKTEILKDNARDRQFAESCARAIAQVEAPTISIEQVKQYLGSESEAIILKALEENGYKIVRGIYNAADYGSYTSRERYWLLAAKDFQPVEPPKGIDTKQNWKQCLTDDIIDSMEDSTYPESWVEKAKNTPRIGGIGVTLENVPMDLIILGTQKGKGFRCAYADELCPTITASDHEARIIRPDGTVKKVRAVHLAKLMGLDNYVFQTNERTGKIVEGRNIHAIGNGIPTQMTNAFLMALENSADERLEQASAEAVDYLEKYGIKKSGNLSSDRSPDYFTVDGLENAYPDGVFSAREQDGTDSIASADVGKHKLFRNIISYLLEKGGKHGGKKDEVYIHFASTDSNVLVNEDSFQHGFYDKSLSYKKICADIDVIADNAVLVNEIIPNSKHTDDADVYLSVYEGKDFAAVVRLIVSRKNGVLNSVEKLYAIQKNSVPVSHASGENRTPYEGGTTHTDLSEIVNTLVSTHNLSIEQFLKLVNSFDVSNSVLPVDVIERLESTRKTEQNITPYLKYSKKQNVGQGSLFDNVDDKNLFGGSRQLSLFDAEVMDSIQERHITPKEAAQIKFKDLIDVLESNAIDAYRAGWKPSEIRNVFNQHPELDVAARLNAGDTTALDELMLAISDVDDVDKLELYRIFITECGGIHTGRDNYRGPNAKIRKAIDARIDAINLKNNPDRIVVKTERREYTVHEIRDMFDKLNTDTENAVLAKKVFDACERFGVKFYFGGMSANVGANVDGYNIANVVRYHQPSFEKVSNTNNRKAAILLHEAIHSVTTFAVDYSLKADGARLESYVLRGIGSSQELIDVGREIRRVYDEIKYDPAFSGEYGISDEKEMMAELSNPVFREKMKKKNLLGRVLDAVKKLFGIKTKKVSAYDAASNALDYILMYATNQEYDAYTDAVKRGWDRVGKKFSKKSQEDIVNQSVTMSQAKNMIHRAFNANNLKEWYEGEYKNADEWAAKADPSEIALYIDNTEAVSVLLNGIQEIYDGDVSTEEIVEAYRAGTLTGKVTVREKIDLQSGVQVADDRFYSPKKIEDAQATYEIACGKATGANKENVIKARAAIVLYAHNRGAAETLGLTDAELNKKLRSWTRLPADAIKIAQRINADVADGYRWAGLENLTWINQSTVSTEDIERMVKSVEGKAQDYEKHYIARTMLAIDTHADWSWLKFRFGSSAEVNEAYKGGRVKRVAGYFNHNENEIVTTASGETVAHEMGHALDCKWGDDIYEARTGKKASATHSLYSTEQTERGLTGDYATWFKHLQAFNVSLAESSDIRNEYYSDAKETFARFVSWFVSKTEQYATGSAAYTGYDSYVRRGDTFTQSQYVQFVNLLQEKAKLDSEKAAKTGSFSNADDTVASSHQRYSKKSSVAAIERVMLENEKMKEYIGSAQKLARLGITATDKQASLTQARWVASEVKTMFGATMSGEDIAKEIVKAYTPIAQGSDDADAIMAANDALMDLAMRIAQSSKNSYRPAQEQYDALKSFTDKAVIQLTATQVEDVKHKYGSIAEFNRMLFKAGTSMRVTVSKGKSTIDMDAWYHAMTDTPEGLSLASLLPADANEGDQPSLILEALETYGEKSVAGEWEKLGITVDEYAGEIYGTLAEKAVEAKLESSKELAKNRTAEAMQDVDAEHQAELDAMQAELDKMAEEKAKWKEQLSKEYAEGYDAAKAEVGRRITDLEEAITMLKEESRKKLDEKLSKQKAEDKLKYKQAVDKLKSQLMKLRDQMKTNQEREAKLLRFTASLIGTEKHLGEWRKNLAVEKLKNEFKTAIAQAMDGDYKGMMDAVTSYTRGMQGIRNQLMGLEKKGIREGKLAEKQAEHHRKTRAKIAATVKDLASRLVAGNDRTAIPEVAREPITQFVSLFTDDTTRKGILNKKQASQIVGKLAKWYDAIDVNGKDVKSVKNQADLRNLLGWMYDIDISQDLADLEDVLSDEDGVTISLAKMDQETLDKVLRIAQHMKHIATHADEDIRKSGKRAKLSQLGMQAMRQAQTSHRKNKFWSKVTKLFDNNITPYYFFKRMGGVWQDLYNDIDESTRTYVFEVEKASETVASLKDKYHWKDWSHKKGDTLTIKTLDGTKMELTREQALSIYATDRREMSDNYQQANHLRGEGIRLEGEEITKNHALTNENIAAINEWLTDEQKAYADAMVKYMSGPLADIGNETSIRMYGYKKYLEPYYFPFGSNRAELYEDLKGSEGKGNDDPRIKNASFTKRTTKFANSGLLISDFTNVCGNHISQMLLYSTMSESLENMNRVFNWQTPARDEKLGQTQSKISVKSVIENTYGVNTADYIRDFMKDVNGGTSRDRRDIAGGWLLSAFKRSSVMASLSVTIQQPSAIGRALAYIDPKYFVGKNTGGFEQAKKYAYTAVLKEIGGFDVAMGRSMADRVVGGIYEDSKLRRFDNLMNDIAGKLPEKADEFTWGRIWNAVKRETMAKNPDLKGEELLQAAGRRFDQVINATQVYDNQLSKSGNMRSNGFYMKSITSFMAEPTVSFNMLYDAVASVKQNPTKENKKAGARAIGAVATAMVINSILKSIISALRHKKDDEPYIETYVSEFVGNIMDEANPFGMIPLGRDIFSLAQGYDVERADMSVFSDIASSITGLVNLAKKSNPSKDDEYKAWRNFIGSISKFTSLPVANVWRDFEALVNSIVKPIIKAAKGENLPKPEKLGFEIGIEDAIAGFIPFKLYRTGSTEWKKKAGKAIVTGDEDEFGYRTAMYELYQKRNGKKVNTKQFTKDAYGEFAKAETKSNSVYDRLYQTIGTDDYQKVFDDMTKAGYEEKNIRSEVKSYIRDSYKGKNDRAAISAEDAESKLVRYAGMTRDEAHSQVKEDNCYRTYGVEYDKADDAVLEGTLTMAQYRKILKVCGGKSDKDIDKAVEKLEKKLYK